MVSSIPSDSSPPTAPVHPDGWPFVGALVGAALVLSLWSVLLASVCGLLALWVVWFFRNPARSSSAAAAAVIAPADGKICFVGESALPRESGLEGTAIKISIFMNVFDVHVNRVPANGTITRVQYVPGLFFNASLDKASEKNERQIVVMTTSAGHTMVFVQIAGLIARRIRCDLRPNQTVVRGERFGLIRFGSRVDIYLDKGQRSAVVLGQRTRAGETVIAESAPQP